MAKLGSYRSSNEQTENPTSIYLDNIKGKLGKWNKDKGANEFTELNNIIVLTVGFTIKGQVWNDSIKKYTNTYFSNEIRQFNETIYAIDMTFNPTIKTLVAKGKWKTDVKPHLPQGIGIKAMITVLDLDDGLVKAFPVSSSQYFGEGGLQSQIESFEPTDVLSYGMKVMYTDGSKDASGNEILVTADHVNKLPGLQASKYKNRYISSITKVREANETEINNAEALMNEVEEYYKAKRKYYEKTYGVVSDEQQDEYAQPTNTYVQSEEVEQPVIEAQGKTQENNSSDEISIEDIPF